MKLDRNELINRQKIQNKIILNQSTMFLSAQLPNESFFSARLSERSGKLQKESKIRKYSHRKVDHLKN
jgi:hypothetical protein